MQTAKAQAQLLLRQLPDDCTFDDIVYHLYVVEKVRRGLEVADTEGTLSQEEVEERVWDSNSEVRYMVLPEKPAGTEALNAEALAQLVTRDAMIGVAKVQPPAQEGA